MTLVCEIEFAANAESPDLSAFIHQFADLPELLFLDHYRPAAVTSSDPYVEDGAAPAHFALLAFPTRAAFDMATRDPRFISAIGDPANGILLHSHAAH